MVTYWNSGGICNQKFVDQLINRLDMILDDKTFIFANVNLVLLYVLLILQIEFCIHFGNNWKVIKKLIMCKKCWWKKRNSVYSLTNQPSSGMLQLVDHINHYEVGPGMILLLCWMFLQTLNLLSYSSVTFNQVFIDYAMFGFTIYFVISSEEIWNFIELKYSQLKYRFGYF